MRLRAILFAVVVFAAAGAAAWKLAEAATALVRGGDRATQLASALEAAGQDWASVATDGLEGDARRRRPRRDQPLPRARDRPPGGRRRRASTDTTTLAAAEPLPPPPFALELLRNEAEVSLIGLVPETGGRDVIRAALGAGGLERRRSPTCSSRRRDPAPEGWQRGARLRALGAARAAAGEDQRGARRGDGDRRRRQRRRPRARSRRGCAQGGAGGRGADARDLRAAAGDRAVRLRLRARRTAPGRLAACSAESAGGRGRDHRRRPGRGPRRAGGLRDRPRRALARLGRGGGARASTR